MMEALSRAQPHVGARCARPAKGSAPVRPRAVACAAGLGFHDGSAVDGPSRPPPPAALFGLSASQMEVLGLTGEDVLRRLAATEASVSARASYSTQVASASNPPTRMVTSMAGGGGGNGPGSPPPDLPSLLLNARICYLGMSLVPSVTELIVAQLLWLNSDSPEKPIYFYVNSTGSQTPDGKAVGFETEAYAIMDTMRYIRPEVHTVCIGKAYGNAAMLLASGKKGCRYALPNSSIMLCPPRMNRRVDSATNLMIGANDLYDNTTTYLEYLAEFTGKPKEAVEREVERTHYFTPESAIAYGLIDKVIHPKGERGAGGGLASIMEVKDYEAALRAAGGGPGAGGRQGALAGARD